MRTANPNPSHQQIIAELEGQKCHCGRRKAAGTPFCIKCVRKLPKEYYALLVLASSHVYITTYLTALEFLKAGRK